jgi:hypothetical protein
MMIDMDPDDAAFHPPACSCLRCEARAVDRPSTEIPFDCIQEDDGEPQ